MPDPEEQLRACRAEAERLAARYDELRSTVSYRMAAPVRLVERAVGSSRKRPAGENARLTLDRLLGRSGAPGPSRGHGPRDRAASKAEAFPTGPKPVSGADAPPDPAAAGIEERLRFYRSEIARLTAACHGIRSSAGYRLMAPVRLVERAVASARKRPLRDNARRAIEEVRLWAKARRLPAGSWAYHKWIRRHETLGEDDVAAIRADIARLSDNPPISIVVLPGEAAADPTWRSIEAQIYRRFEVLTWPALAAPASLTVREVAGAGGPAALFNAALSLAEGTFCLCIAAGDVLASDALYRFARESTLEPAADLIYGDEDTLLPDGARIDPFFKPDWNPELAHAFDHVGRAAVLRTSRLREIGGARPEAGVAWRWDLSWRLAFRAGAAMPPVAHVQSMVLHAPAPAADPAPDRAVAFGPLVEGMLAAANRPSRISVDRRGWLTVTPALPSPPPRVAIVIPTRDKADLLSRCIASIFERTRYAPYAIHVVDNGSVEKATFDYFDSIRGDPRITIVADDAPFNYSAIHNRIVPRTEGEVLAFLNNDIEVDAPSWLDTMVGFALQPDIGIVGAKLHFPDNTIQHGGVAVDDRFRLLHCFRGMPRQAPGPRGLIQISREVQAVTGACMVMRRAVFDEVGGFDESFAVNFNDIDLCLRAAGRGYRVVLAANAELFHLESATRGRASHRDRLVRAEWNLLRLRWESRVATDPRFRRGATGTDPADAMNAYGRAAKHFRPWMRSHGA